MLWVFSREGKVCLMAGWMVRTNGKMAGEQS